MGEDTFAWDPPPASRQAWRDAFEKLPAIRLPVEFDVEAAIEDSLQEESRHRLSLTW